MAKGNINDVLSNLKMESAQELGISNYHTADKGQMTSRQNGSVGGNMVKKMIQYAEHNMK